MVSSRCEETIVATIRKELKQLWSDTDQTPSDRGESEAVRSAIEITRYKNLAAIQTWSECILDDHGIERESGVTSEIWTAAIQTALDSHLIVKIPYRQEPYYIDGPLILRSGSRLYADPGTEIRLKPGTNTCMVRNEDLTSGQDEPVAFGNRPNTDMIVEGGIWTTLAVSRKQANGNTRGRADTRDSFYGAHGVFLFSNVRGIRIRNITIKESVPFGIHVSNCSHFRIEHIFFLNQRRDGVHINGPARYGIIRDISGITGDDLIALNAWDWKQYAVTFGEISHILVEDIHGYVHLQRERETHLPDGSGEIRLLAGTKRFAAGGRLNCRISDCMFRDIWHIHSFKLFDQPNLELGVKEDFADPIGEMHNLFFRHIHIASGDEFGTFQFASQIDGISLYNLYIHFDLDNKKDHPYKLVVIGPRSGTYKFVPQDPSTWVEIFSPDKDCMVSNLSLTNVYFIREASGFPEFRELDLLEELVDIREQQLNLDYPNTTPRGGVGKGSLLSTLYGGERI